MDEDVCFKLMVYVENNGIEWDSNFVDIVKNADGEIYISRWDFDVKKPSLEDLSVLDLVKVKDKKDNRQIERPGVVIDIVKNVEKLKKVKNGSLVYDGQLKIFIDGVWEIIG